MIEKKELFYVVKYKKGYSGNLTRQCDLENIDLSTLQEIFNIDPKNPDIIIRNMVDCYNISEVEAEMLKRYMSFDFDFNNYDYQTGLRKNEKGIDYYIVKEFEKSRPWVFVDECLLKVSTDFLRELFKNDQYDSNPDEPGFSPFINLESRYAVSLQPYVSFKFELDKYDYWIKKRKAGELREIGLDGEEFVG